MNWLLIFRLSLNSLMRNKFRSFLTLLGIILGIAAVITMYNLGLSMEDMIKNEFSSLGTNIIVVSSSKRQRGVYQKSESVTIKDMKAVKQACTKISQAIPFISAYAKISFRNSDTEGNLLGTTPEYFLIGDKILSDGNFWGSVDVSKAERVCILGYSIAQRLFRSQRAVDKVIYANKVPLRVIGVLSDYSVFSAIDPVVVNESIIIPFTTLSERFGSSRNKRQGEINSALLVVDPKYNVYDAKNEVKNVLRERRRIAKGSEDLFAVETLDEYTKMMKDNLARQSVFLNIIAIISLLVGGINIMNIMVVTVKERTREIGVRMALGARPKDITFQFLAEAVFICLVGGMIGVILSLPLTFLMVNMRFIHLPMKFSYMMVVIAFFYSTMIGVIFGVYPARKASLLDPVEALRYE
ncbi:MAG: ABC transporter permease [Armatimonadota bacterium]